MTDRTPGGFGAFIDDEPPIRKRKPFGLFLKYILIFLVCVCLPAALFGWRQVYVNVLERVAPEIELSKVPPGFGDSPVEIHVKVRDTNSGIKRIVVRGQQSGEFKQIEDRQYPRGTKEVEMDVSIDGRDLGFEEGRGKLAVAAFDQSMWENSSYKSFEVLFDYQYPEVEVLTTNHSASLGGSELVVYRLSGEDDAYSYVSVGALSAAGFPAKALDPDFESRPDVYFAFFPIPLGYSAGRDEISLVARDLSGNVTRVPLSCKAWNFSPAAQPIEFRKDFLDGRVRQLYREFVSSRDKLDLAEELSGSAVESDKQRIAQFKSVNETYRREISDSLAVLFSRPKGIRYWDGTFIGMRLPRESFSFGDVLLYRYGAKSLGQSVLEGLWFSGKEGEPVVALNGGKVVYSDNLGLYGKSVIVDHGFGLSTVYAHLSALECSEGDQVDKGQNIGRVGSTGFTDRSRLLYEVRLHGVPVRPHEWWDRNWIQEHLEGRLKEVKKLLGIRTRRALR